MIRAAVFTLVAATLLPGQVSPSPQSALLGRYCVACHNDKLKTGGISLAGNLTDDVGAHASTFEKVLRKVRSGEMPPLGMPRPDAPAQASFIGWLESELDNAAAANPNPGAPAVHRLNRAEYGNAIRDLLTLDLDQSASLPPDDSGYGFDNVGDVLTVSPLHMEKYMTTARRVSRLAVGTVKASPSIERYTAPRGYGTIDGLPLSERAGILIKHYFPLDAEYSLLVRIRGNPPANMPSPQLDLRVDGRRVKLFDVNIDLAEEKQATRNYELRLAVPAGMHSIGAGMLSEFVAAEEGGRKSATQPAPAGVDTLTIGGPFHPTGPGDTESRKRIFACRPASSREEEPCARRIFASLAHQAYRRPVGETDLTPLMKLFAVGRSNGGSFDTGIELGLRAILVSPDFLFRVEHDPQSKAASGSHRVTDLELASRLSFFLWSSLPDTELLQVAELGKLSDTDVLRRQVRRMLADPKSKALVENFAGQWLQLRNVSAWHPDPGKYPEFDESLRTAMRREAELFFEFIVHEDRSVLDFIDADYTFLNERLARYYDIPGVGGSYFRRVSLKGPERGGILTQAAILMVTAYPNRTSPVLRGKWILENVLGAPPPPPPPEVPQLSDSAVNSPKNLREQLEKHRANSGCAVCHSRLDPLGFALENYDAIGKFRTNEGGSEIDASGSLPGGIRVNGPGDLKKVLLERHDQFVECLAEKLLTYALGRGVEYYDMPVVRDMRRQAAQNDYRFSSLVMAAVSSVPFEMRQPAPR